MYLLTAALLLVAALAALVATTLAAIATLLLAVAAALAVATAAATTAAETELIGAAQDPDEEAAEDEEEVTRCLCGQQEYPGPPLSEAYGASEAQTDDAGGLFIQCDGCSVWQHGGCVGIFDEATSPDKYYCEDCRPKQHEVHVDARG